MCDESCRGQGQTKQILVSDSDSEGASDKSAGGASDLSVSQESQQSDSDASSMGESDEDSPPPAKRGKKVLCDAMLHPPVQSVTLPHDLSCYHRCSR